MDDMFDFIDRSDLENESNTRSFATINFAINKHLEVDNVYRLTVNDNVIVAPAAEGVYSGYVTIGPVNGYLARQPYTDTLYDVYYFDNDHDDREEVKYVHGSVYTVPKVEPKQWRTITTVGTTVTYGPWTLLSQAAPTSGTEGTDYEYMKEACQVRKVRSYGDYISLGVPYWTETDTGIRVVRIEDMARVTDQIHGDIVSHFEAPEILENLNAYKHKDNENYTHSGSAGVVKTRRVKRGASNKPEYTTISKKANWSAATNYISATSAQLGQPIEFYVGNGRNDSGGYCPKFAGDYTSTMGGTMIPSTAFTVLGELKDNKYTYKVTLANVTGPIVISGQTQGDGNEAVPEKK